MGDPAEMVRLKTEDGKEYEIPVAKEAPFLERVRAQGLRATRLTSVGPLSGERYGPLDPDKFESQVLPSGPLPEGWGWDATSEPNEYGRPSKLAQQRAVPDQPYFPPKDPSLAASDNAANAAAMAAGGGIAAVPERGGPARGTAEALPGGVPDESAYGPAAPLGPDAGVGDGDPEVAASLKELEDSRARTSPEAVAARGPLRHDARVIGQGTDAKSVPGMLETAWRSPVDLYSLGLDDTMAGIGAMGDEFARRHPASQWLDPALRLFGYGADIPMQVNRQVVGEGRKLQRDEGGNLIPDEAGEPLREPGEIETRSYMDYAAPPEREGATVSPREPVQRNFLQGERGVPMTTSDTYLNTGAEVAEQYEAENEAAFEANPGTRFSMAMLTGAPLAVLTRRFGSRTPSIQEVEQATARAGPGLASLGKRAVAGAVDAAKAPGNIGAAVTSGAGHAKGDTAPEFALDAALQGAGEMAVNAAGSPLAEVLLQPPRMFGRATLRKLRDLQRNRDGAPTLRTAMKHGGMQPEAFQKPALSFWGDPYTSERGVRPGRVVHEAEEQSLARGSAQPAEDLRAQAAEQVTGGLEKQRATETQWIHDQKEDVFKNEGTTPTPAEALMAEFGEEMPPSARERGRVYVQSRLRKFGPEPEPEPGPSWDFPWDEPRPPARPREFQEAQIEGVDARDLDDMIRVASDRGKEYVGDDPHNDAFEWGQIAEALRRVRDAHYPRLGAIDTEGHQKLLRFEANTSGLGIDPRVSPVDTTPGSAHAQSAYGRLEGTEANPQTRDALDRLRDWNPEADQAMDRSRGVAATYKLISDAKRGGPQGAARARAIGPELPPRLSIGIPDLSPGLRFAGLSNLGLHSNAVVREAMSKAVTPQDLEYIYRLLGIRPSPEQSNESKP